MSGFRFFRLGIVEYDKAKHPKLHSCEDCGTLIQTRGGKRLCLPCKDIRLEKQIAARRHARKSP